MRERGHRTDVIMVTAARDVATVQAAMRLGALHYLVKPFTFAALRTRLDAYAALRRTLDERAARPNRTGRPDLRRPAHAPAPRDRPPQAATRPTTTDLIRQVLPPPNGPLSAHESPTARASAARPPSAT